MSRWIIHRCGPLPLGLDSRRRESLNLQKIARSTNWFMPISTWIEPEATELDFSLRLEELMRIDGSGFAVCCDLNSVLVAVLFVVRVGSNLSRHDVPPG